MAIIARSLLQQIMEGGPKAAAAALRPLACTCGQGIGSSDGASKSGDGTRGLSSSSSGGDSGGGGSGGSAVPSSNSSSGQAPLGKDGLLAGGVWAELRSFARFLLPSRYLAVFYRTPLPIATEMLKLARVGPNDVVSTSRPARRAAGRSGTTARAPVCGSYPADAALTTTLMLIRFLLPSRAPSAGVRPGLRRRQHPHHRCADGGQALRRD
jgi:hypothetical protein